MADKLSAVSWTDFVKKQKLELDDKAWLKALAGFDKTTESKPAARLESLDEVLDQGSKQLSALARLKKELGDKPYAQARDKLQELLDTAEGLRKDAQRAIKQAEAGEAEEEDSPALLTSRMVPLVRQLQKGQVTMHGLIAVESKRVAVLIMRRPIAPARRKLLAEYLQVASGLKYLVASISGDSGELTFQLDTSPGGLSKKLRQALFEQTGLRCRVMLRFGEEAEADGEGEGERATHEDEALDPAMLEFQHAVDALYPAYEQAIRARPADAGKLRALLDFAQGKAGEGQYASATAALAKLREFMAPAGGQETSAPQVPTGTVAAAVLRAELETLRVNAAQGLSQLLAMLARKSDPLARQVEPVVQRLAAGLPTELEAVLQQLDTAVKAEDSAAALALRQAVREKIGQWLSYLKANAHEIRCAEANPWNIAVSIERPVRAALAAILKTSQ